MTHFLLFLGLALALVLGNVMMLRPSGRDKALLALRAAARAQGLQVQLQAPPEWLKPAVPHGLIACYTLFVEEGRSGLSYWRAEQRDREWFTKAGDNSLLTALAMPPEAASLLAIEAHSNAVHLFWSESLGPESLPALLALARQIVEKLK